MTRSPQEAKPITRVPTGVAGLDVIMHGGFFRGDLYIIMGLPGTGKTIMANQICFNHVKAGGRALYVTLLAETHGRMLAHLRSLAFFDSSPISDALYYVSAYRDLAEQGLRGLLDIVRRTIRERRATLLVIDGFVTAAEVAQSDVDFKRFLHELQVYLEPLGCTTLLLMQYSDRQLPPPEHTMVDGLIELSDHRHGMRAAREMEVRKMRGSAYLRGRHFFNITDAGIVIYPRTEVLLDTPRTVAAESNERVAFGVAGLDAMLNGGVLRNTTTMFLGATGTGKTLLGLHFLAAGAQAGEPGLHFGFYETPARLAGSGDQLGLNISDLVRAEQIEIAWQIPLEHTLDELAARLLDAVQRRSVRRLFIDGLDGFQEAALYPERLVRFFTALTNELRERGVTTICSLELRGLAGAEIELPFSGVSSIVENIVLLRHFERRAQHHRLISVLKVRGSAFDAATHEFHIGERGIDVATTSASAEFIMTETSGMITAPAKPRSGGQRQSRSRSRR